MPKLNQVVEDRKTISIPFGETSLRVTYNPSFMTPRIERALAQAQRDQDIDAALLEPTTKLIRSWDLCDNDDQVIALTVEALADVPSHLLMRILEAVGDDARPNPPNGGSSNNGSSQTASSAPVQIGT